MGCCLRQANIIRLGYVAFHRQACRLVGLAVDQLAFESQFILYLTLELAFSKRAEQFKAEIQRSIFTGLLEIELDRLVSQQGQLEFHGDFPWRLVGVIGVARLDAKDRQDLKSEVGGPVFPFPLTLLQYLIGRKRGCK